MAPQRRNTWGRRGQSGEQDASPGALPALQRPSAEDRDNPCPGLCPRCLDQEMTAAVWLLWHCGGGQPAPSGAASSG